MTIIGFLKIKIFTTIPVSSMGSCYVITGKSPNLPLLISHSCKTGVTGLTLPHRVVVMIKLNNI